MTYPVLEIFAAIEVADQLRSATHEVKKLPAARHARDFLGLETRVTYAEGASIDEDALYEASELIRSELLDDGILEAYMGSTGKRADPSEYLEELMAERIHRFLDQLPPVVLQDARFWRYLGLFPFRWYLLIREPELQVQDYGGSNAGRDKWLMIRTYQWGRKCHSESDVEPYAGVYAVREVRRAAGATEGMVIDFYHSHIVRPRWADTQSVALGFIGAVTESPPLIDVNPEPTQPVRTFARRVSRLSGNVCLPFLGTDDLHSLLMRERS